MTIEEDMNKFLESGICIVRNPKTMAIEGVFQHKFKFKIPEIHKALYGEDVNYKITLHDAYAEEDEE